MKRKIRVPGEKTELICENCQAVRKATWNYDDFHLEDGTVVHGAMVAHCDLCGQQAALASQSSYLVREAREKRRKPRMRTTVTLSRALRDLAETRLLDAGTSSMNAVEAILLSLLAALRHDKEFYLEKLRRLENENLLSQGKFDDTVTIRLSLAADEAIRDIICREKLNRSEFVRRAILLEDKRIEDNLKQFALV